MKNKMTVTRREVGGDKEGKGRRAFRNNYKGLVDKTEEGGVRRGRWGWWGCGVEVDNCT